MTYLHRVEERLAQIRAENRYREVPAQPLAGVLDFSSNDYLGLAAEPQVVEALKHANRVGSGGARLLGGRHREHWLLEAELARWLGRERALLFSSGYHAALGAIPVLATVTETIASDACNHASLIDGIRLARAPRTIYAHGLPPRERDASALVVSESIFSMEGDAVDPATLFAALRPDDVLLVDEAHALGVAGPQGAGLARALDDPRIVVLGTLSKALGAHGGFVAGPAGVIELLANRARTFNFDNAQPPAIVLAARIALMLAQRGDDRRARLHANVARLRERLRAIGLPAAQGDSPILPVVLGSEAHALRVAEALRERRIAVPAIRPPTVPPGTSRLRLSVRADHTPEQIDFAAAQLQRCIATL
jgi:8-amino-7-oxononanoate synthase